MAIFRPSETSESWTWHIRPIAVRYVDSVDCTYWGAVGSNGDIIIHCHNHTTDADTETIIDSGGSVDDHNNPAIYVRTDGKILVLWSEHGDTSINYRISTNTEDISAWDVKVSFDNGGFYTYCQPIYLSGESKLYLFIRNVSKWEVWTSSDEGDTGFTFDTEFWYDSGVVTSPYTHPIGNGVDTIWFSRSDWRTPELSYIRDHLYVVYYYDGAIYNPDGTLVSTWANLPITDRGDLTKVYDSDTEARYCYNYDIQLNGSGYPVIAFTTIPKADAPGSRHNYAHITEWNGSTWTTQQLLDIGKHVVTDATKPHYSGAISVDPEDTTVAYLSAETSFGSGHWEVQKWSKSGTWAKEADISADYEGLPVKAFRPFVPVNRKVDFACLFAAGTYTSFVDFDTTVWAVQTFGEDFWVLSDGSEWAIRQKVSLNYDASISSELASFTIPIVINDDAAWDDLWKRIDETVGYIQVTDTGGTLLPFELEDWDFDNQNIILWVKTTVLAAADTEAYLYYQYSTGGSPPFDVVATAWDASLESVYHLSVNHDQGAMYDSITGTDLTNTNVVDGVGVIDRGRAFDRGGTDKLVRAAATDLMGANVTAEVWVKFDTEPTEDMDIWVFASHSTSAAGALSIWNDYASPRHIQFLYHDGTTGSGVLASALVPTTGVWYHICVTIDGTTARLYIDGVEDGNSPFITGATAVGDGSTPRAVTFGQSGIDTKILDGDLDEARWATATRTADWVKATFEGIDNATDWTVFGTVSPFEQTGLVAPQNLAATLTPGPFVGLTFDNLASSDLGIKVYRDTSSPATTLIDTVATPGLEAYEDTTAVVGNTYYYRVTVYNAVGESDFSNEASIFVTAIPNVIHHLQQQGAL